MNESYQPGSNNWFSIGEAAKYLRVSKDTLRRWEKNKIIKSYRSPTNHRYYKKEELEYVFSQKPDLVEPEKERPEVKAMPRDRFVLVIITLLTIYIILMIFLAWLLLHQG